MRVAYLLGAGATHASIKAESSPFGILMRDLGLALSQGTRDLVKRKYSTSPDIALLANEVVDENVDFEHVITFLEESVSALHRRFAVDIKDVFLRVLRARLSDIEEAHGSKPIGLFNALLDIHNVRGINERISGVITLNYDDYFEHAVDFHGLSVDLGIPTGGVAADRSVPLLKLHGSFDWDATWPVGRMNDRSTLCPLWIPPGIQKVKRQYPYNLIWGRAREILNCDLLRIIGCRLSQNDWDLISLLFTTRWELTGGRPYHVELIDSPRQAELLKNEFPYLEVQSMLDIDDIGGRLVSELIGGQPRMLNALEEADRKRVLDAAERDQNWFVLWLTYKAEALLESLGSIDTERGALRKLLR